MDRPLLLDLLEDFFGHEAPLWPGDSIVAAFSGGPDSTALLWGLLHLGRRHGFAVTAAHLDHGMDHGSAERARAAARLARDLGADLIAERCEVPALREAAESAEAAARRIRYGFLEKVRNGLGARYVATAHHRDDQAETVLLRLLFGTGLEGLAGIRPVHGNVVRPLLAASRSELRTAAEAAGLAPLEDPTNLDLAGHPRNRVRHRLLPALPEDTAERFARLAGRARRAGAALDGRLAQHLELHLVPGGAAADLRRFEELPEPLRPHALAALHRRAGAPYPAGTAARDELLGQLGRGPVGCDCGGGWRWEVHGGRLVVCREREQVPDFTYTLEIPGEVAVPEIALRIRLTRRPVAPWMFQGAADRAALALPLEPGSRVTVRNRRPGDRLHPLGAGGTRRLKEVLIDRRVPEEERDRLPLLCVEGRIAWVPGVTIDQRFRLPSAAGTTWVAEVMR